MPFKVNDQVVVRRRRRDVIEIKVGQILSMQDGGKTATVVFERDRTKMNVAVDQLESVTARYGNRARVNANPTFRSISVL